MARKMVALVAFFWIHPFIKLIASAIHHLSSFFDPAKLIISPSPWSLKMRYLRLE
jgi:hypothetical protein